MVIEWIVAFSVVGNIFLAFTVWVLHFKIPTVDGMIQIGDAVLEKKIHEFGLAPPPEGAGGKPAEGWMGMLQQFINTPKGGEMAENFLSGFAGGGRSFTAGLKR